MKRQLRFAKSVIVIASLVMTSPSVAFAGKVMEPQAVTQQTVKGTVVDENGEPMIGVTVRSTTGKEATITDIDGNYSLNVPASTKLVLSYVGYKNKTVSGGGRVAMEPDNQGLNEVVVIGYGTVRKRDALGAISSVKSEEIKQAPTMNAMEGLQGKIAGLDITRESGAAGTSPTILLRGTRSLSGSNNPLYVIDGISGGSIDDINPNDIESIEVLKDASSTAIYGSAGANGVIIVTTKQGKPGKVQVDFNAYVGINTMPAYPDTYQGEDWINYMADGYQEYYGQSIWDEYPDREEALNRLFDNYGLKEAAVQCYKDGKFINWKDEILKTGVQQNYNVSVRGGNEKLTSYMSAGYQNEKGMYRKDNYQAITFRAGATYNVNKMVTVGFQSHLAYKDRDRRNSRLSKTLNVAPVGEVYNEDGSLKVYPTGDNTDYVNIMADDMPYAYLNNTKSTSLTISPFVEIKPVKGLSFRSQASFSLSNSRNGIWNGLNTYYKLTGSDANKGKREASQTHGNGWGVQWQNILNYNIKFNDIHDLTFTGIMEWNESKSESMYGYNNQFDYDFYTYYNLSAGLQPELSSSFSKTQKLSYAGRINYNLMGRYLLTATMRWDGASQLYHKWDSFPSVAVGWRISDEPWMEKTRSWLDNLKLRIGYGITGNSNIAAYSSKTLVQDSNNNLNLGGGKVHSYILTQAVANYDLGWEKSYNWNFGLDFAFLNSRIDGSLEFYTTDTKGVLYSRPLPSIYGVYNAKSNYTMMSNIAKTLNKGIELTLNTRNIVKKDFQWTSTFTFTKNNEKLKKIDMGNNTSVDELIALGLFIDHPVKTYYGYKKEGIWQSDQADQAICFGLYPGQVHLYADGLTWDPDYTYEGYDYNRLTSERTPRTRHGAYYSVDADGNRTYYRQGTLVTTTDENGKTTTTIEGENFYSVGPADKQILGHKQPDFTIGFTNNFTYKNFDLSIQAVMRWGFMTNGDLLGYVSALNQPKDFDYWTESNPTNAFPLAKLGVSNYAKEALQYVDGSFVKIKNITLGYSLPNNLLKKLGMTKLRVYGTIQNPFIFCKDDMMKGLDPENTSSEFPLYKTIVFGINASF